MSVLNKASSILAHVARKSIVPNVLEVVPKRSVGNTATPPRVRVSFTVSRYLRYFFKTFVVDVDSRFTPLYPCSYYR